MNTRIANRIDRLEAAAPSMAAVDPPEVPPGFTGTLLYGANVRILIPDNGRGPIDHPKPNVVRIGS